MLLIREYNFAHHISPMCLQISCKAEDKLLNILALLHLELVQKKVLIFVNKVETGIRLKLFFEQVDSLNPCLFDNCSLDSWGHH